MKYREMSKNYIFRELECQMTKEEVAELCFKTVRTVTGWDEGKPIPPECKRLMRMAKGRELGQTNDWKMFKIHYDKLELPTGQLVTAQQVLLGLALLEIQSELELQTSTKLLKYARALSHMLSVKAKHRN
ncbi:Regulator [Vibrio chagasii]|nr:Regulator [Vibrio chagasii]CAH7003617.1 Regulator [Vibrio chagasii]CAH7010229.1 Regulator [Vibrio chagasii]CAH7091729.1 Regulator [Vibrio chagasii]CAH7142921.1 Regulator [Vibrio chagasii]